MEPSPELVVLLKEQDGLASRKQLLDRGVTPAALRHRLSRTWRTVLPGVVATSKAPLTAHRRVIAAHLFAGPDALVASSTAAAWHGVESARSTLVTMSVPGGRASRQSGFVVVRRTTRPDPSAWHRPPLLIASRARAVVDAAQAADGERQAAAIVIEAVQRQLVTAESVRHELERAPRHGSRQVRLGLAAAERGAWSVPELELATLVAGSAFLPEAWPNPVLSTLDGSPLPTPDLWFDDVGLAIQLHSRAYHLRELDWDATVAGDTALGEQAVVVLGVTPTMVRMRSREVLTRIERAYCNLQSRPRPAVLATPRFP